VLQTKALADALQADYPAKAAELRDWNHATAVAMITWLDTNQPKPLKTGWTGCARTIRL
jgi:hypothetical protein